jgi:CBS domain-containing membrane protein
MEPVRVAHLMSTHLLTLFAEQTLPIAEELMSLKRLRHIPVVDDDGRLVGLVSHRDLLRAQFSNLTGIAAADRRILEARVPVSSIMTVDVWTVPSDMLASKAGELLLDHRFGCLPVVDADRRLVGMLTEADFLRFAIKALEVHDPK